jgi:hypothetical protein
VIVCIVVGAFAWLLADPQFYTTDFQFYYRAARLWHAGVDPYALRPGTPQWPLWDRLFYPLPALILVGPFAPLTVRAAQTAFVVVATALLAWRLSRHALWPLLIFCTPSFIIATFLGQWSPWLVLSALVPAAGFLFAAKPTLGLACWLYRPTWTAFWSGVAIMAISLLLMPDWPAKWLHNLSSVNRHIPPILTPGGFVLALAVRRWRDRDARFLLAMACVPQIGLFADQLPLFLICRTKREALTYVGLSGAVFLVWGYRVFTIERGWPFSEPYAMLGCYGTALYVVLRRPTAGVASIDAGVRS